LQALKESLMKVLLPLLPESSMPTLISHLSSLISHLSSLSAKPRTLLGDCNFNGVSLPEWSPGNEMPEFALGSTHVDGGTKGHACRIGAKHVTGASKTSTSVRGFNLGNILL
jgi:hypothetical protein